MSLVHVTVIERNYGNQAVETMANARHPAVVAAVEFRLAAETYRLAACAPQT